MLAARMNDMIRDSRDDGVNHENGIIGALEHDREAAVHSLMPGPPT